MHRDLKPANVMLKKDGTVKIADFGISSQLESTAGLCETFVGTTCYMSPERLNGENYSYSADVWALGLILLELASGAYPYARTDSYFALLGCIMDGAAPTLPAGSGFSDAFGSLLSLCLDKVPQRRPASKDLLRHPWFREAPPPPSLPTTPPPPPPGGAGTDARRDRSGAAPLDRSRSSLKEDLEMTGALHGLTIRGGDDDDDD